MSASPATPGPGAGTGKAPPLLRVPSAAAGLVASVSAPASAATSPTQLATPGPAGSLTPAVSSPPVSVTLSPALPLYLAAAALPPSSLPAVAPLSSTPFDGASRHCSFVLLAEFDILKGSQLKYQYPKPTNIKENLLAESMLPEGAHLRESDWTVSFLSSQMLQNAHGEMQKAREKAKEKAEKAAAASVEAAAGSSTPAASTDAPPSWDIYISTPEPTPDCGLCVLNLVRTKMDKSVKRGAIVKALAIVTRHRFYNIFKSLLMLCLDQYFDSSAQEDQIQLLANLYHTINNIEFDSMPVLTPLQKRLHRATRLKTASSPSANDFFNTTVKWNTSAGGSTGSAAPLGSPLASSSASSVATLPIRIPLCMESDEVLEASLTTLVNRFQNGVLDIYTAVLAEKRVVFMGYQQPAAVCCDCVLAACLLISPPVTGTLCRAFPYANLTNLDFLTVPGFIAGVTNPIFESRSGTWWDLLCNISNGELTFAPGYAEEISASNASSAEKNSDKTALAALVSGDNKEKLSLLDGAFFSELLTGIHLKLGEEFVRCMFRDLTLHLLLLVTNEERFVFDDAAGNWKHFHLSAHSYRIAAFTKSKQCAAYRLAQRNFQAEGSALKEMDSILRHHVRTLQVLASAKHAHTISPNGNASLTAVAELLVIFHDLVAHVRSRDEILELLAMLPESQGGLFPIAVGLIHKHPGIRASCIELLHRIDQEPEGTKAVSGLNYFLLITFYRSAKSEGFRFAEHSDEEEEAAHTSGSSGGGQQHQLAHAQSMPAPSSAAAAAAAAAQAPGSTSASASATASPSLAAPRRLAMRSPSSDMGSIAIATPMNPLTPALSGGAAATPAGSASSVTGTQHPASATSSAANHQAYMAQQAQRWNPPAAAQTTTGESSGTSGSTSTLTIHTVTPAGTDTLVGNYPNAASAVAGAATAPAGSPSTPAALLIPSSPASPADELSSRSVRSPTFHSDEAPASATDRDPKIPSIAE